MMASPSSSSSSPEMIISTSPQPPSKTNGEESKSDLKITSIPKTLKIIFLKIQQPWMMIMASIAILEIICYIAPVVLMSQDNVKFLPDSFSGMLVLLAEQLRPFDLFMLYFYVIDAFVQAVLSGIKSVKDFEKRKFLAFVEKENTNMSGKNDEDAFLADVKMKKPLQFVKGFLVTFLFRMWLIPVGAIPFIGNRLIGDVGAKEVISVPGDLEPENIEYFPMGRSIGYTLMTHCTDSFTRHTTIEVKHLIKTVSVKTAKFAIRNPLQFRILILKILTWLRWIKYLAPLIGTANKLNGNLQDLIKKYEQHARAKKARKIKEIMMRKMSPEQIRHSAATRIQSSFRSKRSRNAVKAMEILRGEISRVSIIKLQSSFRAVVAGARVRIERKKKELADLENNMEYLTTKEKIKFFTIQNELNRREENLESYRMLLRPNTPFSVTWKSLFVFCVLVEMIQKIVIAGDENRTKMSLDALIQSMVLPPSQCLEDHNAPADNAKLPRVLRSLMTAFKKFSKAFSKKAGNNVAAMPSRQNWFILWRNANHNVCTPPSALKKILIKLLAVFITQFVYTFGIICYLDVFVTFFTGELDQDTGILAPKPFFGRWILPGLLLQLLVNPFMKEAAFLVKRIWGMMDIVGPAKFIRWWLAFGYLDGLVVRKLKKIFQRFAAVENSK